VRLQQGSSQLHNLSDTRMVTECVWLQARPCDDNAFAILA